MSQSSFGKKFVVTTWGESHGKALGVVVDGCPAGLPLTEADIQIFLDRRRPGQNRYTTSRKEGDEVEILSGVFEGQTTGAPISMIVYNKDQRSRDYGNIAYTYRPGHADFGFDQKYGFRDTEEADVPPAVKPSDELPQEPLPRKSLDSLASPSAPMQNPSVRWRSRPSILK